MASTCIFCDNKAGSEEHIWPAWLHREINFGPLNMQEGVGPQIIADDPEQTVNSVCPTCNNTWMSRLEEKNIPSLKPMVVGNLIEIDPGRQRLLREWVVKTAMVNDSTKLRNGIAMFFSAEERAAMRATREIPDRTRIWIGKIAGSHLGIHGTDFSITNGAGVRFGEGSVVTIYMGHFVTQVVTEHIKAEFTHLDIPVILPRSEDFSSTLVETWPKISKKIIWPPSAVLEDSGTNGIHHLMARWRMGEPVQPGSI